MPTTDTPNSNLKDALVALAFILMMILPALAWLWIQQESKCIPPECISGVSQGVATKYSDAAKDQMAKERAERIAATRPKKFLKAPSGAKQLPRYTRVRKVNATPTAWANNLTPGFTTKYGTIPACFNLGDFKLPTRSGSGKQKTAKWKLKRVLNAPCLYARYPELKDAIVQFRKKCILKEKHKGRPARAKAGGIARHDKSRLWVCISNRRSPQVISWTILHEIQHLIQRIEGRPSGKHSCYQRELEAEFAEAMIRGLSNFDPTEYPRKLRAANCKFTQMQ